MAKQSSHRWTTGLVFFGVLGALCGWAVNEALVWQLGRHTPQHAQVARAPAPSAPAVAPEVSADDWLAEETVTEEPAPPDAAEQAPEADESASAEPAKPAPDKPRRAAKPRSPKPSASPKSRPKKSSAEPKTQPRTEPASKVRVFRIVKAKLKEQAKAAGSLAAHGRVVPHVEDGRRSGLEFVDVAPGGIFARLGIHNGDVIVSVNGTEFTSQQNALSRLEKMRKIRTFDVILERGPQTLHYRYILE